MSSIDKMAIQGIRSFGPRDQDTQVIQFFSPVTLIVGANGTGKTTIIECLKYATTGELPPMSRGGAFVFDPKLIDEIETKGRIKLFFRDMSASYVQVQKNMSVTQKAKKVEFRTLETIISRYDKDYKLASTITSKCINADYEVINALGVSKAVLDNVIFCHQEESNWPLSDGKTLKTKFDEIFSATKYIKVLDVLKKIRLEKQSLMKQNEVERRHLETNKLKSDELLRKYEENEAKYEEVKEKIEAVQIKLKPIESHLEQIEQESLKIYDIQKRVDNMENERNLLEKQMKELIGSVREPFEGSDAELKKYMEEFYASLATIQCDIESNEASLRDVVSESRSLSMNKSKLVSQMGALENENKNYMKNLDKLSEKLEFLAQEIKELRAIDRLNVNDSAVRRINGIFESFMQERNEEIDNELMVNKQNEVLLDADITKFRDQKSKLDQMITMKQATIEKNLREIIAIKRELSSVESSVKVLDSLDSRIRASENSLKDCMLEFNQDDMKILISSLEKERQLLNQELNEINKNIDEVHENTAIKTQIDMLKKDKQVKEDNIRKIQLRHRDELCEFFGEEKFEAIKDVNMLKSEFDAEFKKIHQNFEHFSSRSKEINKQLIGHESQRKMLNEDLRKKERQMRDFEDKLQDIDDVEKFDALLEETQELNHSFVDEKGFMNGVDKTYNRFVKQLTSQCNNQHSCPVCMRDFRDAREVADTISELQKYTAKIPQKIKELDEKIAQTSAKYELLNKLKPVKDQYIKLKNEEIPNLRRQIEQLDEKELKQTRANLKANDTELHEFEKRKNLGANLINEVIVIDKYLSEAVELDRKIRIQLSSFNQKNSANLDVDIDELKSKKENLMTKLNSTSNEIEKKRLNMQSSLEKIQSLRENINNLKNEKLKLNETIQKQSHYKEKLDELNVANDNEKIEIGELREKIQPLLNKIDDLVKNKKGKSDEFARKMEIARGMLSSISKMKAEFDECVAQVRSFEKNDMHRLRETKEKLEECDRLEKKLFKEQERLKETLEQMKSDFSRQELKKRELDDNRKLREKRIEYANKMQNLKELKEEMNGFNISNIRQEQKKAESKREELRKELSELRINLYNVEGILKTLQTELESEQYRNAEDKYRICASDLKVLEMSVQDIEKYSKALDRAIMNYHNMKMDEINKSIKHIWKQVYRGNDIDYIEIRSEDDAKNDEAEVKLRKTYNYRVVIIKGDTAFDMRGRCSCGQKVLASIIIRLALAETFGLNCGILALDEPTTNLDRDNIESLATALVDIIRTRSVQKNFQLIIITHDEDFVEMLGRSEYMDEFYRVHKDHRGFSTISRKNASSF